MIKSKIVLVAGRLREWFTKEAMKNIKIDFLTNMGIIALDREDIADIKMIEVETLSDKEDYEYYKDGRNPGWDEQLAMEKKLQ